jgi:hypothetical protein
LKEQKTAKKGAKKKEKEAAVHETAIVQDTAAAQEMSEPYMAINSFSQTFAVMFEKYTFL